MADRITQQNKTYIEDGSTSKKIGIDAPAGVPADWTFTLPATDGTAGQILKTDGNGNTDWIDAAYDPAGSAASVQSNLDTHTGNTSNPHSTTKSQVGLSNVTNDEQLKRAAGDINSFTEKTSPIYDDLLLLEDSESSFAKKKIKVGSIAGSGINYIKATDGSSAAGWTVYTGSGLSYPDANDYNPSGATVTFASSSSSAMRGATNFIFTHQNINAIGEGFSYLCAIDPSDRGKVLRFNFEYLVASGTYSSGDLTVWFHDVTNNKYIQGAPTSILNSSLIERYQSEVQIPIDCAQMRVLIHVSTNTATAYTMRFENFSFGPSEKVYGQQITDPIDTGVTVWGASTTAPTKGVTSQDSVIMWREGKMACGIVQYKQSAATGGSAGSGYYKLNIASNLSKIGASAIDLSLIPASALSILATSPIDGTSTVGSFSSNYSSTTVMKGNVVVNSSTELAFHHIRSDTTGGVAPAAVTSSTPFFNSGSGSFSCYFKVPIVGWSSSSQVVSDDYTGRKIVARASVTSAVSTTQLTPINYNNVEFDSVGAIETGASWKYRAKDPGTYVVTVGFYPNSGTVSALIYKNGSLYGHAGTAVAGNTASNGSVTVDLNANEYVDVRPAGTITPASGASPLTLSTTNFVEIHKLQGPSQVLASETICFSARSNNANAINVGPTLQTFNSIVVNTHNSFNGSTFTAPSPGLYHFNWRLGTALLTLGTTQRMYSFIQVNGVTSNLGTSIYGSGAAGYYSTQGSCTIPLNQGQNVTLYAASAAATAQFNDYNDNYFSCFKVK